MGFAPDVLQLEIDRGEAYFVNHVQPFYPAARMTRNPLRRVIECGGNPIFLLSIARTIVKTIGRFPMSMSTRLRRPGYQPGTFFLWVVRKDQHIKPQPEPIGRGLTYPSPTFNLTISPGLAYNRREQYLASQPRAPVALGPGIDSHGGAHDVLDSH